MEFNKFAIQTLHIIQAGADSQEKYDGVDQGQSILREIMDKTEFTDMAAIVKNAMKTLNAGELGAAIKIITNPTHQEDARRVVEHTLRSYEQQWGIISLFAEVVQLPQITLAYMGICQHENKIKIHVAAGAIADDMIARWSTFANRK
jgi:hypothetical protein